MACKCRHSIVSHVLIFYQFWTLKSCAKVSPALPVLPRVLTLTPLFVLAAPAKPMHPSPALIELIQNEPTPSVPLTTNSPLPTSFPMSLEGHGVLSMEPSGGISSGPSIPSAPVEQVTQQEPSPPAAQEPQQALPPLVPSCSPQNPRSKTTDAVMDVPPPSQVRRAFAGSPAWQDVVNAAAEPSHAGGGPLSPRNCVAVGVAQQPAVSLLDLDVTPPSGLDVGDFSDLSPATAEIRPLPSAVDDWGRSSVVSPSQAMSHDGVHFNDLFASTPGSEAGKGARAVLAMLSDGSPSSKRRLAADENSCDNLPGFLGN